MAPGFTDVTSFTGLLVAVLFLIQLGQAKMAFKCEDGALSLPMSQVCNHMWDCPDGSDELPHRKCPSMGPGQSVHVTSPGWPGKYPNNASVIWTFASEMGLPLLLQIVHFDLQRNYDFLVIGGASDPRDVTSVVKYRYGHDKYTDKPFEMYANLTGNDDLLKENIWRSEVSEMWMYFESDSATANDGFQLILSTPNVCKPNWVYFEGSCYRLIDTVMQYSDAALYCSKASIGGHLAVIHSSQENDLVAMVAESNRAWIGASRKFHNSKEFFWINGDKKTFTNWRKLEPNNFSGKENCVEINYVRKGLWNDHFCIMKKPFVCEMPAL
ncbi:C-type lectin domain family 4 member G-like [Apostichopus japonicus]|uniref:C-type lectin domain family 4 member G-like n=1 Tax=Stichopus japonicus TaxID=307972 RepID=UPI003AB61269